MDKLKLFIVLFISVLVGILLFSLTRSWIVLNRGLEVKEQEPAREVIKQKKNDNDLQSARILWNDFLYYAIDLNRESGGYGPDELLSQGKNLVFINIKNGKKRRVFQKNIYIHDFFPGSFSRTRERGAYEESETEALDIGKKMVILAADRDVNEDGFLNRKDGLGVFVYDPYLDDLTMVTPAQYSFERLHFNSSPGHLVLTLKKMDEDLPDNERLYLFLYNANRKKGKLISP